MSGDTATAMDAIDIAEFLGERSTGVLSLARDDEGYAVPLSYTFERDESAFYFRLGYGPDSHKRRFVEDGDVATFVVYDDTDEGWKSVVARGHLEELTDASLDSTVEESVRHLDIPFFAVHDRAAGDLQFAIARLDAVSLDGVVEGGPG